MKKRWVPAVLLVLLLLASGCQMTDYWTFGGFRYVWNDFSGKPNVRSSKGEGMILVSVLALCFDVVFLPMALLHDLFLLPFHDPYEEVLESPDAGTGTAGRTRRGVGEAWAT